MKIEELEKYENTAYNYLYLEPLMNLIRYVFILWNNTDRNTFDTIREYMTNSEIRQKMDRGLSPFLNKGSKQVFNDIDLDKCRYSEDKINESILYWMADIYTYLQWRYNIPSKNIYEKINAEELAKLYYPLHETSIKNACEKLYNSFLK